ncbi:MAG: acetate--CoA ligase family protein [Burkholderiales bacterium]|nr:acetate--CoA ligase family protein [Burkholderiales bacterium]
MRTAASAPSALQALAPLFKPANVAVLGSMAPGKLGHTAIRYLKRGGFSGGIYPVNPSAGMVEGLPVFASVSKLPVRIDCALLVVPAQAAAEAVRECAASGVRAVIIGANGFAELGTAEGRERQAQLVRIARETGMRVMGPNTNGIFNASARFSLGYNASHGDPLTPGPVSIAAHSGALFNSIAPRLRQFGAGLSKFVPVGNEADLSLLDFVEYFIEDEHTRVIGLIIEGIAEGARFCALAARARQAGKPLVALKLGRSVAGAGATQAHSSRLAGSARAFEALCRDYAIASVPTVEALAGACAVLLAGGPERRARDAALLCVATTGGGASMLADFAAERGIALAGGPDGAWGGRIAETIAGFSGAGMVRNPTDTGALGGRQERMEELFFAQEAEGYDGPVMVFTHSLPGIEGSRQFAGMMIARQQRTGSPVLVVAPGGLPESVAGRYRAHGVPLFADTATAFDSLQAWYRVHDARCALPPERAADTGADLAGLAPLLAGRDGILSELESAQILRRAGLPMVHSTRVSSAGDALAAAAKIGYPVVLKALVPGVAHKNAAGLVAAGIADAQALARGYESLLERAAALGHAQAGVSFILQPMLKARAELIVGVSWEEPLGHFLLAGLGGIYAEVLDEVVLMPVPVPPSLVRRRLEGARVGRLALAVGGEALLEALAGVLCGLQSLILAHGSRIRSIDINPLLVGGGLCVGVDALVVAGATGAMRSAEPRFG